MSYKMCSLDSVAEIAASFPFRYRVDDDPDGPVHVVQMQHITSDGDVLWGEASKTESFASMDKYLLRKQDVLFMLRGANFQAICLNDVPVLAVASTQFFRVRVLETEFIRPEFLAWQLNQDPVKQYFSSMESGSTIKLIRIADLKKTPIVIPPLEKQDELLAFGNAVTRKNALLQQAIDANYELLAAVASRELSQFCP